MTIFEWLHGSMVRLKDAGVDSPRRDCLVLVEDLLEKDRAWVLAHHEHELNDKQLKNLESLLKKRINREPLAYIRSKVWFYGRFFEVNPDVLIPRPESESFIEILKEISAKRDLNTIWDIGTGSGCLAITAKKEIPGVHVSASDVSARSLSVARSNARLHCVNIRFVKSDLLESMPGMPKTRIYAIVANLPYVPDGMVTSPEITHEPAEALFSGKDGLDHYRKFWPEIEDLPNKPKYVLTESLKNQHKEMIKIAENAGFHLQKTDVLVQLFSRSG